MSVTPDTPVDPVPLMVERLRRFGYQVAWRGDDWAECGLFGHGEAWTGLGATRAQALENALSKALPSRLARAAWGLAWSPETADFPGARPAAGGPTETAEPQFGGGDPAEPRPATGGAGTEPDVTSSPPARADIDLVESRSEDRLLLSDPDTTSASFVESSDESDVNVRGSSQVVENIVESDIAFVFTGSASSPLVPVGVESGVEALAPAPEATAVEAHEPAPVAPVDEAAAPTPAAAVGTDPTPPSAAACAPDAPRETRPPRPIEDPHDLLETITDELDAASDLPLFAPFPMRLQILAWIAAARDVQDRHPDRAIEKRVSGIAHRLQVAARAWWPGNVAAMQKAALPTECSDLLPGLDTRSWDDVARAAQAALSRALTAYDDYGWGDAAQCEPRPRCPASRLGDARKLVAGVLGPDAEPRARHARECLEALTDGQLHDLVRAAALLRWIRGAVDAEAWGRLVGLVRWIASAGGPRVAELSRTLEPTIRPSQPWAALFGYDPDAERRAERLRDLPPGDAPPEALLDWLRRHGADLDAPALADALRPHAATIRGLDVATALEGSEWRILRDRVRKVQKRLADPTTSATAPPPAPPPPLEAHDAPAEPSVVEQARTRLAGRTALFVSNREDPDLRHKLRLSLGIDPDWATIDQQRALQGVAERIRHGGYGVVLLATGFMSHHHEHTLMDAARDAGVPAVRAAKGRPVACALAILRDLPA